MDRLNTLSYAYHYRDLDSVEYYASAAKETAEGLNNLAFVKMVRMDYKAAEDYLWTPTEFVVFKICGNDNEFWFEPTGVYKTTDLELKNPLDIDLSKLNYPKEKFSKKTTKISDINRLIKKLEWNSFDRKNLW